MANTKKNSSKPGKASESKTVQAVDGIDNADGLSGILTAVFAQTAAIQTADNAIDQKANNLMAAALVVVALFGTQLTDGNGQWHWLIVASVVVMVSTVFLVLYLTRSQQYFGAIVDLEKHREYFSKNDTLLLAQLIEDANFANDQNEAILACKNQFFRITTFVFLFGFGAGILALFMVN